MNLTSEKYGLDLVVWLKTTFVAKITMQCLLYKVDA